MNLWATTRCICPVRRCVAHSARIDQPRYDLKTGAVRRTPTFDESSVDANDHLLGRFIRFSARWLAAYSNYEHEMIAEQDGGLPPAKVQALIAGLPTSFEIPRHQVVYEITTALIAPRVVPTGLYRRAVNLLGDTGLTDWTVLIGYFTCISLTLMAYDKVCSILFRPTTRRLAAL